MFTDAFKFLETTEIKLLEENQCNQNFLSDFMNYMHCHHHVVPCVVISTITQLHSTDSSGVFRTQPNIYVGAFLQ